MIPITAVLDDLRDVAARLTRTAHRALMPVAVLALGVSAVAAVFGLVDALLFCPPPHVREPQRVVRVPDLRNYVHYQRAVARSRTLELAVYTATSLSVHVGGDVVAARVHCVSPNYFALLGTPAQRGRLFGSATSADAAAVIISDGVWTRFFGRDGGVLGKVLRVGARAHTVVGVTPPEFRGLDVEDVDAWLRLDGAPEACSFTGTNLLASESGSWLWTIGRLRGAYTRAQAGAELAAITDQETGERSPAGRSPETVLPTVDEARRGRLTREGHVALWLVAAALAVLFIACANVAGLLSIRAIDRRRDTAIRYYLGASRARLAVQLLMENAALSGAACAVALVGVVPMAALLRGFFPQVADRPVLGVRVLAALLVFGLVSFLASGVVPAVQASRPGLSMGLRAGGGGAAPRSWFRGLLLVAQVALALVLAAGTGLFARSLGQAQSRIGYDLDGVVVATIDLEKAGVASDAEVRETFRTVQDRVSRLPEVAEVAVSSGSVLGSGGVGALYAIRATPTGRPGAFHPLTAVSPGYFSSLGVRVRRGRAFTAADSRGRPPVLIVDDGLARETWPGEDAVGKCAFFVGRQACTTVVGVVDARAEGPAATTGGEFFVSEAQAAELFEGVVPTTLLVRVRGRAERSAAAIARTIRTASPRLPFVPVRPLADLADVRTRAWRLGARVFGLFGGLALALAVVGLYVVLAFSTRQRVPEIGVRMALGAGPLSVVTVVARHAMLLVLLGWALGLLAAAGMGRLIASLLFDVAPTDWLTLAGASLLLVVSAIAAAIVPALRAVRVQPVAALRAE